MTRGWTWRALAACTAGASLIAACGSDKKSSPTSAAATGSTAAATPTSTAATTATTAAAPGAGTTTAASPATTAAAPTTAAAAPSTAAAAAAWKVDTGACADEAAATAKITGTVKIGSVIPLTGGVAVAFAPVADGLKTYMDYANENKLLGDTKIQLSIEDDQYLKDLTPAAVSKLIDGGANLVTGIVGSPDNEAVRDTLNNECIPQLLANSGLPIWGDVKDYPWTTGALVPYDIEAKIYATQISKAFPNGAKVALFYTNNDFGKLYADAVKSVAGKYKLTIVDEQTAEASDSNPPTSQITSIASKKPDAIVAAPLGAACILYLKELSAQKAQNAGWDPQNYVTNTCAASSFLIGIAGAAADGVVTASNVYDAADPANAGNPKVKAYADYMAAHSPSTKDLLTAAAGWTAGEITVAIMKQAQDSPDGLSRASIINAARNFDFTPSLLRAGIVLHSHGEKDPFLAQSLQVLKYSATTKSYTAVGDVITDYES